MPDYKTLTNASRSKVIGYAGDKSDQSFASTSEVEEGKDWDEYKKEKNLMFTATRKQHADPFATWRKARAAKRGQKKAVEEMGEAKAMTQEKK